MILHPKTVTSYLNLVCKRSASASYSEHRWQYSRLIVVSTISIAVLNTTMITFSIVR